MKLTNMKVDRKAREAKYKEATIASDAPEYPYGLSLSLDDDTLEKLGVDDLPAAGATVTLTAKATVSSVSINDGDGGKRKSMSLQITDLAVAAPSGKSDDAVLFGKDK